MHKTMLCKLKLSPTNIHLISGVSKLFRRFSTAENPPAIRREFNKHNLYYRLSTTRSSGENVSDVLDQLSKNHNNHLVKSDLIFCIKKLRKFRQYQCCLQILEWMKKGKFDKSDHALFINIIYRAKGINEAEKYFDNLPSDAKKSFTYGTLLNCYCSENMTEKALDLFKKMDEMNYANNDLAFTNLMCLYTKLNHPEKVIPLVEEMKQRKIGPSAVTYVTWIHSYACLNDLEGIERVMDEVQKQVSFENEWKIYSSFASAYIKVGQNEKAYTSLERVEEILGNSKNPDRMAYHHLISLYARVGDLERVIRVWDKLKSKFKACNNLSYLTMLQALSKLGSIEHLKKYFEQWNSKYRGYDVRLLTVVIGAYLRHEMVEEAEQLLKAAAGRGGQKIQKAHVIFMEYYLGKCKSDFALRHLEVALDNKCELSGEMLDKFWECFMEEKDVDGAENFLQILGKGGHSITSSSYLRLLLTYAAAGKTAPEIRQRMVRDGADVGTEHEELLKKVCPDWVRSYRFTMFRVS